MFYNLRNLRKLVILNVLVNEEIWWKNAPYPYARWRYGCMYRHYGKWDVNKDAFKDLVNLEYLHIQLFTYQCCFIKFDYLSNLKWLHLVGFSLDQELIDSIKSEKIVLLNFEVCKFRSKIFIDNFPNLKAVKLNGCENSNENETLEFGNNLKSIELLSLNLIDIKCDVSKPSSLKSLVLNANRFNASPNLFKQLDNLEEFHLDVNQQKDFDVLKV